MKNSQNGTNLYLLARSKITSKDCFENNGQLNTKQSLIVYKTLIY